VRNPTALKPTADNGTTQIKEDTHRILFLRL